MILISIKEQVKKYYTYLPGRNLYVKKVEEDKEKTLVAGMNGFLIKPVDPKKTHSNDTYDYTKRRGK